MPLFTFVLEFDGGTHISQFRATSFFRAVEEYGARLLRDKAVAKLPVRRRLSEALSAENPVAIKGVRNVWCCSASIGKKLALLNVVATAGNREPTTSEERIHLRTGPSLVIWELLIRTLRNPEVRKEVSPGNCELLFRLDEAERLALNYLAGAIQRAVPDALAPVKPELIAEGKLWLLSRPK
jgi:hypothetical protein